MGSVAQELQLQARMSLTLSLTSWPVLDVGVAGMTWVRDFYREKLTDGQKLDNMVSGMCMCLWGPLAGAREGRGRGRNSHLQAVCGVFCEFDGDLLYGAHQPVAGQAQAWLRSLLQRYAPIRA